MINHSGIGTYIKNLIPYLKEEFELSLLGNTDEIKKHFDTKKLEIIKLNSSIYSPLEQIELPLKIKNCDIFWSPHFNMPIFPIRAKKKIATIHDLFHFSYANMYNPLERTYAQYLIRNACQKSELVITVSQFSKSEILRYIKINPDKIKVVYNGVNLNFFKKYSQEVLEKFKREIHLPQRFLLYVGNVKPHKNLRRLIIAFKEVSKIDESIYLVIVGKKEGFIKGDNYLAEFIQKENIGKRIIFTGYLEENKLPLIYNLAIALIFPSLYEGFGLPPLEAMACGCPVIASSIPPLKEIYRDCVYYINPYNIEEIKNSIIELLNNDKLRNTLIEKGSELAKNYSWEKSAKEHINIIKNLF